MNDQTNSERNSADSGLPEQEDDTRHRPESTVNPDANPVGSSDKPRAREEQPQDEAEAEPEEEEPDYENMPFDSLWRLLSDNQRKYVLARQATVTVAAAAERIGMHRDTAYGWPDYVDIAASRMVDHRKDAIREGLSDAATRAAQRLTELLDADDGRTAIKAVQYALDQEIGKAVQKQELKHSGSIGITDSDVEDLAGALDHLSSE